MKHLRTHLEIPLLVRTGSQTMFCWNNSRVLSEREFEVLALLAQGRSVKNIAQSLTRSNKSVSTYRTRLLDKVQLTNTAELIRYALDHHLVE